MWSRLGSRLRALWRRRRQESDLDAELAFHLSEETEERVAAGAVEDEARRAAARDFGNTTRIREEVRDAWGWTPIDDLVQDIRYGSRVIRRHGAVSALSVATLALGIGATTAILHVVAALIVRPLPLPAADNLVRVFATSPKHGIARDTTSFFDFSAWKAETRTLAGAAAFRRDPFNVTGDGLPEPIAGLRASHELFSVLGLGPAMGRGFDAQEQREQQAVAVISHRLWTERYGRDPNILGRSILLNELRYLVVGVMPPGFRFPPFEHADVILPILERPCRSCGYLHVIARLKAGVPRLAAQQALDAVAARLEREFPDSNEDRGVSVVPLKDVAVEDVRTPLLVLLGAGVFVLLIGCANVGHLILAKGLARQRELALRTALGAGRGRLIRQLLTESVVLALIAAAGGALLAYWGSALLVASLSQQFRLPEVPFNAAVLVFALGLAFVSGILSALPPALMIWRANLNDFLKRPTHGQSGDAGERRLGDLLIVAEAALTMVLLIGAALLLKGFLHLEQIDLGLETRHALSADLVLSKRYAGPVERERYTRQLLDSIGTLPGVQHAAIHVDQPFQGGGRRETFRVEGRDDPQPGSGHPAAFNIVSGDFFAAMDLPLVRGRAFDAGDDRAGEPVAIINETMARRFWPNGEAIGQRLQFYYDTDRTRWWSIVGIIRDVRYRGRLIDPVPQVFVPSAQPFYKPEDPYISIVVRTAGDPAAMLDSVRARIWVVDPNQPIANLQPANQVLWESAAAPRVYVLLLGTFATIALVIACAGIYGVSASAVARRTRELGIRLALGATTRQGIGLVVQHGLSLILIGLGLGIAGALALTRLLTGFLYGITPTDATTFLAVTASFVAIALLATYLPARRAATIDPTVVFRSE